MQAVQAYPLTYDIGQGSAPGFSGSWLHAGTDEIGNSGFFANGEEISIMGSPTIDQAAGTATGAMSGTGDFGLGGSDWLNANGSIDRADSQGQGGTPLGLDLYGEVPEPPVGLLLLAGLFGAGLAGKRRT